MPNPDADNGAHRIPGIDHGGGEAQCVDWCPICRTADVLRASTTPEVREQWREMQREALLTVRALIDHYVQHLEDERAARDRPPTEPEEEPRATSEPNTEQPRPATPVEEIPPVE